MLFIHLIIIDIYRYVAVDVGAAAAVQFLVGFKSNPK